MDHQLIGALASILECSPTDIALESRFRELPNWDSLAYMSVIAMIDSEFDVVVPPDDFRGLQSVSDIITYLRARKG